MESLSLILREVLFSDSLVHDFSFPSLNHDLSHVGGRVLSRRSAAQGGAGYTDFAVRSGQVRYGANRLSGSVRRADQRKTDPVKLIHFELAVQPS